MSISEDVFSWLETTNPLLYLTDFEDQEELKEVKELKVFEDTEVLIIKGVDVFDYTKALERNLKVLLVEDNKQKIATFLAEVKPHSNLYLATSEKEQIYPIIKKFVFKKIQFEGNLADIASYIDGMQMSYSEYKDLGKKILPNILSNLLFVNEYIDGRRLKDLLEGEDAIVCGNGLSLKRAIEEIHQMKRRPLIFSVGSSLPVLIKAGIIPDFWVFIDHDPPIEKYACLKDLSIPLFYQNRTSKEILFHHKGPKIFMGSSKGWQIEDAIMQEIYRENFAFDAGCHAGNFGAHVALSLGCKKVILAGMDGVAKAGEEVSLERDGKMTRSDLFYGMDFFKELKEEFSDQEMLHYTEGFAFDDSCIVDHLDIKPKKRSIDLPEISKVDQKDIARVIDSYFDHEMLMSLKELFLEEDLKLQKAKAALLLAEFSMQPLFMNFLSPLWGVWKDLLDHQDQIAELTFYYQVLSVFKDVSGYIGDQFYLFGKKEGKLQRFDKNGVLREEGLYFNGKLWGAFKVYDAKGALISCEDYKDG